MFSLVNYFYCTLQVERCECAREENTIFEFAPFKGNFLNVYYSTLEKTLPVFGCRIIKPTSCC